MSYIKATEVMCDVCSAWFRVDGGTREADRCAREAGWKVRILRGVGGTRHECRECIEERKIEAWKNEAREAGS